MSTHLESLKKQAYSGASQYGHRLNSFVDFKFHPDTAKAVCKFCSATCVCRVEKGMGNIVGSVFSKRCIGSK